MSEHNNTDRTKGAAPRRKSVLTLRAASFAVGLVCALAGCSLIGKLATERNIFKDFGRFHTRISPESFFQPTAREVYFLSRDLLDRSKTNVVVGGSSVFYGVGQPQGQTLADNLRRELGDNYRVINLAMRGGDVSGIAEMTVESLLRDKYRVVYVSDIAVGGMPQAIGSTPYQYFYWDSKARNMLLEHPARDAAVHAAALSEPVVSAMLNRFTYVFELWNTVGYDWLFTVYSRLIPPPFWQARKLLPDNEIDPPDSMRYRNHEIELRIISNLSVLPTEAEWVAVGNAVKTALPEPVRKSTVLAVCENSSWLLDQSTEEVRKNRKLMRETMAERIKSVGVSALISCDGFEKDDYIDRVHLSISGASKIAPRLAEGVRMVTRNNGWMP